MRIIAARLELIFGGQMKHFLFTTLATLFAAFASMATAATTTWYVNADNGSSVLTGNFEFDDATSSYLNINLNVTGFADPFSATNSMTAIGPIFRNAADTRYLRMGFSPSLISGSDPIDVGFSIGNCVVGFANNCSEFLPTAIFVGLATDDGTASTAPPVVPLPAGLPLLLTGFAAFAGLRSRKRGRP